MKTSEVLIKAKAYLSKAKPDGKPEFICNAIGQVVYNRQNPVRKALIGDIQEAISPSSSVTDWLDYRHGIRNQSYEDMQAYRHRWVDAMILDYQSKGD